MVGSINKVILVGNLGADPTVSTMPSGDKVVNLRVATSDSWTDKASGERKERTEWHRVVIFNSQVADTAERYLRKGSKVYLEGQLQTRKSTAMSGNDDVFAAPAASGWDNSAATAPSNLDDDIPF